MANKSNTKPPGLAQGIKEHSLYNINICSTPFQHQHFVVAIISHVSDNFAITNPLHISYINYIKLI